LRYNPPPSPDRCRCGGRLVQRQDDTEEVVRKRFDEYLAKTAPLLDYYKKKGLVRAVNGVGSLDEVTARLKKAIGMG
jgi:adenylate kinase